MSLMEMQVSEDVSGSCRSRRIDEAKSEFGENEISGVRIEYIFGCLHPAVNRDCSVDWTGRGE